jgi:hypothetical protein
LNDIFVENKGYVLENDEQFKKVGFNNLTILPDNTIKDDHIKSILKDLVYSKFFTKYVDEDSDTLIYDRNTNSIIRLVVPIDIGEWDLPKRYIYIYISNNNQ